MNERSATVTAPRIDPGRLAADDPRLAFARSVALGGAVIEGVRPDQLGAATPCTEFDVRTLLAHLVGVLRRVAVVGRGGDPLGPETVVEGIPDDGWLDAWRAAGHEVQEAWSEDAVLDRDVVLPWTTMAGRDALAIYVAEVTLHTWDLAVATQQLPVWDDEVVGGALATMQRELPADLRGPEIPFAPVVEVAGDAALIERLAAWTGRRP